MSSIGQKEAKKDQFFIASHILDYFLPTAACKSVSGHFCVDDVDGQTNHFACTWVTINNMYAFRLGFTKIMSTVKSRNSGDLVNAQSETIERGGDLLNVHHEVSKRWGFTKCAQ